ncbi:MAG TPA: peptidase S24, partial [bacterium]|nr:peptidase S24 [bacterium]
MRLYAAGSRDFVQDANRNLIAEKLKATFFDLYRFNPSDGEVRSWQNSLRTMAGVLLEAGLKDNGVIIEYRLPLTSKRLDFMITGQDQSGGAGAVIVELKQWDKTRPTEGERLLTFVGGAERPMLHPSVQVGQYCTYLSDTHTAFYEGTAPIALKACSFLHNYLPTADDPLLDQRFSAWTDPYPVFTQRDAQQLGEHLYAWTGKGNGLPLLDRIDQGKYRPSKKLMDHVAAVIEGDPRYILLDEQLVVLDRILALSQRRKKGKATAVVVKGGPGTGKSVIALNLM